METPHTAVDRASFGINLYGYLTSNVGLGVVARNTATMLRRTATPFTAFDVGLQGSRGSEPEAEGSTSVTISHPVNLFHLNPDRLRQRITRRERHMDFESRMNAVVPFWETPRMPRAWLPTLAAMDVVLAPTLFVRDAVLADLPDANVVHFPQAAFLPDGIVSDRASFGIPEDRVVFVMSFALASDIDRKNPWGAIKAFEGADLGDTAMLVIKVNNPQAPGQAHMLRRLKDAVSRSSNVMLLERPMSYPQVLSLYSSCDVLVSLHRSEGLGLNMLEAMLLGVPCLATGWSGNMDFMSDASAALVDYRLVDIDVPSTSPYHRSNTGVAAQWAEPDAAHAATLMRELAQDAARRSRIGDDGRSVALELQSRYLEGHPIHELERLWRSWNPSRPQLRRLKTLERSAGIDYLSWAARGAIRRIRARFA